MITLILLLACAPEAIQSRREPVEEAEVPASQPADPRPIRGLYCIDLDEDGWGDGAGDCSERESLPYAPIGDCDDGHDWISPDAPEVYNGVDDNCDGQIDEGLQPV